mgnify:FL=1
MNSNDIDQFLAERQLPGVVGLAINQTDILYEGAFGVANTSLGLPLEIDAPHAIMSMTKPITSFATMMLVESGELSLNTPVYEYLPEYQSISVLRDVNLTKRTYSTEPLSRPINISDLLTNTSGLGYDFSNEILFTFQEPGDSVGFPLLHQPGQKWTYSLATKLLGDIIAAIKGQSLEAALKDLILTPLGMDNTSYEIRDNQVFTHAKSEENWQPLDHFPYSPRGDGGLISTAHDYSRFLQCLLNDGKPLMTSKTFKAMISNQIGELFVMEQPAANAQLTHPFPMGAGIDKFGFGFQLAMSAGPARRPGSYSWCGLFNTFFWGDPVKKIGGILLMQTLPFYSPVCLDTLEGFEKRLYQSAL